MSLLESLLSIFLNSLFCLLICAGFQWQHHLQHYGHAQIQKLYGVLIVQHELAEMANAIRPLICSMPCVYHSLLNVDAVFLEKFPILKMTHVSQGLRLAVWEAIDDGEWIESKQSLLKFSEYLATDFHQVYLFSDSFPGELQLPFFLIPVRFKEYQIRFRQGSYQLMVHHQGVPQVLADGFEHLDLKWQNPSSIAVHVKISHLPSLHWIQKICEY